MNTSKFNIIIPPQDIQDNPECLAKIAAGDASAFSWLYKNYCGRVYDYAMLLTGDGIVSEDILQIIFLKLWAQRELLAGISNFNAYVTTAARNEVHSYWRKQRREMEVTNEIARNTLTQTTVDLLVEKEKGAIISEAINGLTERQRQVYRLCREAGKSRIEISEALNITPCTVKVTMQNALKRLKEQLRPTFEN